MPSREAKSQYKVTIGIECHVQLKTATKLFAAVGNDAREAAPNTLISHICFGLPGALPVLNREAVNLAMRAAFALNTKPQKYSYFERKHYFYPDLPLGYQISQLNAPIILGGSVVIDTEDGKQKSVQVNRVQIEADAGKSTHPEGADYSLVDLNRAGTPLLEIVSEPDISSAFEAKAYAKELYLVMRYADVSDCNMYYGNMRFDVNVSVSKTDKLGTRTETKNLNSFKAVEKAVEYEIDRQIERLEKGEEIVQETRGWNDAKQKTFSQRTKEEAHDYRYFPDPDLPPVELDDKTIQNVESEMPVMPAEWRKRLASLGMDKSQTDTLLMGEMDEPTVSYLTLIEQTLDEPKLAKYIANMAVNLEIPQRREDKLKTAYDNDARLHMYRELFVLTSGNKLSSSNAKLLTTKLLSGDKVEKDIESYAKQHNMIQQSDTGAIEKIVKKVLEENPKAAQDVANGEMKAIGFLVGQVMKQSQGQANPQIAQELIKKHLEG